MVQVLPSGVMTAAAHLLAWWCVASVAVAVAWSAALTIDKHLRHGPPSPGGVGVGPGARPTGATLRLN
jgi:hypothetical protein